MERGVSLPWVGSTDQTQLTSATATRDASYETGQVSLVTRFTSLKLPDQRAFIWSVETVIRVVFILVYGPVGTATRII